MLAGTGFLATDIRLFPNPKSPAASPTRLETALTHALLAMAAHNELPHITPTPELTTRIYKLGCPCIRTDCLAHGSHPDNPCSTNAPGEHLWANLPDPEDEEPNELTRT